MKLKRTDEFRPNAVWIELTSRLKRNQVAGELDVGMLTLNKWITVHQDTNVVAKLSSLERLPFSLTAAVRIKAIIATFKTTTLCIIVLMMAEHSERSTSSMNTAEYALRSG